MEDFIIKKLKKLIIVTCGCLCFLSATAYAVSGKIDTYLPKKSATNEYMSLEKGNNDFTFFSVRIDKLDGSSSAVRVWTEGTWGGNYSDPTQEVERGKLRFIPYYSNDIPKAGSKVVLNLENPNYVDTQVHVTGEWTPN